VVGEGGLEHSGEVSGPIRCFGDDDEPTAGPMSSASTLCTVSTVAVMSGRSSKSVSGEPVERESVDAGAGPPAALDTGEGRVMVRSPEADRLTNESSSRFVRVRSVRPVMISAATRSLRCMLRSVLRLDVTSAAATGRSWSACGQLSRLLRSAMSSDTTRRLTKAIAPTPRTHMARTRSLTTGVRGVLRSC
jgi:hypothetical protein